MLTATPSTPASARTMAEIAQGSAVGAFAVGLAEQVISEHAAQDEERRAQQQERDARQAEEEERTRKGEAFIRGTIKRVRFRGEGFFLIVELEVPGHVDPFGQPKPVYAKGNLAGASEWDDVELSGQWRTDPKWGLQFFFSEGKICSPSTEKGVISFLTSHLPAIGAVRAREMIRLFGRGERGLDGVWHVLEHEPARLAEVKGITPEDVTLISEEYASRARMREAEVWLRGLGLGPKQAAQVLDRFRASTRTTLEADPYLLMDLRGFGWKKTDDAARRIGVPSSHPGRARAGTLHLLQEAADGEGHTYLPLCELLRRAEEDLGIPSEQVVAQLATLISGGHVATYGEGPEQQVCQASLALAEETIAQEIRARMAQQRGKPPAGPEIPDDARGAELDAPPDRKPARRRKKTGESQEHAAGMDARFSGAAVLEGVQRSEKLESIARRARQASDPSPPLAPPAPTAPADAEHEAHWQALLEDHAIGQNADDDDPGEYSGHQVFFEAF